MLYVAVFVKDLKLNFSPDLLGILEELAWTFSI